LEDVKALMRKGAWIATLHASNGALALGFDDVDIVDCILNHLAETHFYKTMMSVKPPLVMQDVYRLTYEQELVYLKLRVTDHETVIVSFQEDEGGS
jgi:hypothetical protein